MRTAEPEVGTGISLQKYAKIAGVLLLITMVAGGFGEFYVPTKLIVTGNPTATASNIVASESFLRLGFAAYLLEAVCDITLSLVFYVLLRRVNRSLALLAAFFGLVSTAVFAGAELFFFAATFILGGADHLKGFSPDQLNSLAYLSLKFYGYGGGVFLVFYGIGAILRGYLIFRSVYLPRIAGILLMLGGLGFVLKNFTLVLTPSYSTDMFLLPMSVAGVSLTAWLLIKRIDPAAVPSGNSPHE
jgi:hypothetical protein